MKKVSPPKSNIRNQIIKIVNSPVISDQEKPEMTGNQTEHSKAIANGYPEDFIIARGRVFNLEYHERMYAFSQVVKRIVPCPVNRHDVIYIETPDGNGIATVPWPDTKQKHKQSKTTEICTTT